MLDWMLFCSCMMIILVFIFSSVLNNGFSFSFSNLEMDLSSDTLLPSECGFNSSSVTSSVNNVLIDIIWLMILFELELLTIVFFVVNDNNFLMEMITLLWFASIEILMVI